MKIISFVFVLFVQSLQIHAKAPIPDDVDAEIIRFCQANYEKRNEIVRHISEAQRIEFIKWVHIWQEYDGVKDDEMLMQLGEEATMQKIASRLLSNDPILVASVSLPAIKACESPRLIELIAPAIFVEEDHTENHEWLVSTDTEQAIRQMLAKTPGFNSDVINWARNNDNFGLPLEELYIMRQWWKENEKHFKERNYLAVQPGPTTIVLPSTIKVPAGVQLQASPDSPKRRNLPPATPPLIPPQPSIAASEPTKENSSLVAGLITTLCAALIGLAYWRISRREKTPR